jgi:hypothetical protein
MGTICSKAKDNPISIKKTETIELVREKSETRVFNEKYKYKYIKQITHINYIGKTVEVINNIDYDKTHFIPIEYLHPSAPLLGTCTSISTIRNTTNNTYGKSNNIKLNILIKRI